MVQASEDYDVQQDLPQAMRIIDEMNSSFKQVTDLVGNMIQRVKSGEMSTEHGLSFLEMKYHMLLNYLINLTYVVLRKCSGEKIENDPAIDRLIEIRTVLEKIRPIDHKLRYQIDKLVKSASTGAGEANDPTSFKPKLLSQKIDSDASEDESDEDAKAKHKRKEKSGESSVYVPPKLTAVHYEEDSKAEKARKQLERAKKRALGSSIIQDLKDEYLDIPREITGTNRAQQMLSREQQEKTDYEEAYLTRLPITKEEKRRQRRLTTLGSLGDEITGDLSALAGRATGSGKGKKRKGGKNKKAGGKKRKFH